MKQFCDENPEEYQRDEQVVVRIMLIRDSNVYGEERNGRAGELLWVVDEKISVSL